MSNVRCIGLDVHAETIAVAVAEPDGDVRSLGVIPNRPASIQKLVKKLGPTELLRVNRRNSLSTATAAAFRNHQTVERRDAQS